MHVKCIALVNDVSRHCSFLLPHITHSFPGWSLAIWQTVGALLSRAYTAGGCILGAIFGTGTNGAYVEKVANITKLGNSPAASRGGYMVVNAEWGAFNQSVSCPSFCFPHLIFPHPCNMKRLS